MNPNDKSADYRLLLDVFVRAVAHMRAIQRYYDRDSTRARPIQQTAAEQEVDDLVHLHQLQPPPATVPPATG